MRTSAAVFLAGVAMSAFAANAMAECDHGGGGGGAGGGGGENDQRAGKVSRGSGVGAAHASTTAAANYQALRQAGYYRDAKTGGWYYQPDITKAAVRVSGPPALYRTAGAAGRSR